MQPIFTIHAGEYLVGSRIEEKFGKSINVWIPAKDTGIDLLLTDKATNSKTVSIQVKFSKDFLQTSMSTEFREKLLACGWWTLNREKLEKSNADYWIFALHSFKDKEIQHVIIKPKKLLEIYNSLKRDGKVIPTYIWVTNSGQKTCWETRDLKKESQLLIANGTFTDDVRDMTPFLEDWRSIEEKLGINNIDSI